jgi:hypothetical protein
MRVTPISEQYCDIREKKMSVVLIQNIVKKNTFK